MRRTVQIIASILLMLSLNIVFAQSQNDITGSLRYVRETSTDFEFVTLAGLNRFNYRLPSAGCVDASPNGEYLAQSTDAGTLLVVQDFATQKLVFQTEWSALWKPCAFFFSQLDENLIIIDAASDSQFYLLNFQTGQITTAPTSPGITSDYSFLPDLAWERWVLPAPDNKHYFYGRCANGITTIMETYPHGDVLCSTQLDWAIYDSTQTVSILQQTSTETLIAHPELKLTGASWSPDSRYLAYLAYFGYDQFLFPLRVFDTQTAQMRPQPSFGSVDIDHHMGIRWSPDGSKIAVWAGRSVGESEPQNENLPRLRQLVFLDLTQNLYITAEKPYGVEQIDSARGYWSPDSRSYAFQDSHDRLIVVNIANGTTSVLDTNLAYIITWSPVSISTE